MTTPVVTWRERVGRDDATVEALRGSAVAARLYLELLEPFRRLSDLDATLRGACRRGYEVLAIELGYAPRVWVVSEADVFDAFLRGKGLGTAAYARAAALAGARRAIIVPMFCVGGHTSSAAASVWRGRRFAEACAVAGHAAVATSLRPGRRDIT